MKRKLNYISVIVFLIFIGGCTSRMPGQYGDDAQNARKKVIKVGMWGSPIEIDMFEQLTQEWEKDHPDIDVKLEHTPGGNYFNKLLTQIAGGAAPDIIFIEVNDFVPFAEKELFLSLNPFLQKDASFDINAYYSKVVDRFTVNDNLYAIPRDTAPFACVYYNKSLFDQAGLPYPSDEWDVNDLLETAKRLTKISENGKVTQFGFYTWAWMNFVYAFGGDLVDDVDNPTKCVIDTPEAIAGLTYYKDLMVKHRVSLSPMTLGAIDMSVQQLFMNGRLAMYGSGIWETPQFLEGIKDFDWDVAMFPKGPDGKRRFGTGGSGYAIIKQKRQTDYDDTWEVLKLLSGAKEQIMLAEAGLAQPAIKSVSQSKSWGKNDMMPRNKKMLDKAVNYTVYGPFTGKWKEIEQRYVQPQLELAFRGDKTIEEAVELIVNQADSMLK